jgi:GNAT superfamily N-acetyltransferase
MSTADKRECVLRPMVEADALAHASMLKRSFNQWYRDHGLTEDFFKCADRELTIFWEVYRRVSPGHCVVAVDAETNALLGACFYHPREHHVSLGIMAVDPDSFGRGVGGKLVKHIADFTDSRGYASLRLVGSAGKMESFSLYNRAGFVPRAVHQDLMIPVPANGIGQTPPLSERVRDARLDDVAAIRALELEISGICREEDYRFLIENPLGCLHASVIEDPKGNITGFAASIKHTVLNMIGPAFARTEEQMLALMHRELDRFRGVAALAVVPMDKRHLVEALYRLRAVNVETHLLQVRGKYQPIVGVNLPSFLPESG